MDGVQRILKCAESALQSRDTCGLMQEPHPQINVKMEEYLTRFAAVCVCVATVGVGGVAFLVAKFLGANRKWSTADKLTVVWLVYNSLTHFILVCILMIIH